MTYQWSQVSVLKHQSLVVQRLRKTQKSKAQTRPWEWDPQGERRSSASLSFTLGLPRIIHLLAFHSPVHMNGSSLSLTQTHTHKCRQTLQHKHTHYRKSHDMNSDPHPASALIKDLWGQTDWLKENITIHLVWFGFQYLHKDYLCCIKIYTIRSMHQ